jgi:hypothetical protein
MPTKLKTTLIITAIVTLAGARSAAAQDTIAIAGAPKPPTISSAANDSAATPFDGWVAGASVGVPGDGRQAAPELFTLGLSVTYLQPRNLGFDFSIGTMPRVFAEGFGVVGARANVVLPLPIRRDVVLLPGAGVSAIGALGSEGGGGIVGFNAGLSAIFATGPVGLRVGATYHRFETGGDPIWLVEFGIVNLPSLKSLHHPSRQ